MIEKNLQKLFSFKTGINIKDPQGLDIERNSARQVRREPNGSGVIVK